jgi:hypothetical protein
MNLPHLPPLLFAKEVTKKEQNTLHVKCEFPYSPTLPMLLEAAAQASAGFSDEVKAGFLVAASNIVLEKKVDKTELIIKVEKEMDIANMAVFSFCIDGTTSGKFTIYVK